MADTQKYFIVLGSNKYKRSVKQFKIPGGHYYIQMLYNENDIRPSQCEITWCRDCSELATHIRHILQGCFDHCITGHSIIERPIMRDGYISAIISKPSMEFEVYSRVKYHYWMKKVTYFNVYCELKKI